LERATHWPPREPHDEEDRRYLSGMKGHGESAMAFS
jgi:hypothetical protein